MRKSSAKRKSAAAASRAGDDESARGRLLSAATHLFCKDGINATGIDAIIHEAGTAKTTLYKLFGSKTNLVHAVLESEGKQWREWFIGAIESGGGDAEKKLSRIFPALKSWFGEERFYGCPFINAVAEHDKDQKQFRAIAMKHKKVVLAHIEKLAGEMGAAEPEVLAHQLLHLGSLGDHCHSYDGAEDGPVGDHLELDIVGLDCRERHAITRDAQRP